MSKKILREYEKYRVGKQAAHELRLGALKKYASSVEAAEYYPRLEKICDTVGKMEAVIFPAYVAERCRQTIARCDAIADLARRLKNHDCG